MTLLIGVIKHVFLNHVVVLQQLINSIFSKCFHKLLFFCIPLVCQMQLCGAQLTPIYLS